MSFECYKTKKSLISFQDQFDRNFSQLAPSSQQTGILFHVPVGELPFKPVKLRDRDKKKEEIMWELVMMLKGETVKSLDEVLVWNHQPFCFF